MAIPELEFPNLGTDPLETIWEALKTILRADVNLKTVRTIRLWEGNVDDAAPPAAVEMPWVRVTPLSSPMVRGDEASWRVEWVFKYELAVQGTNIVNLLRLFGAFRQSLNFNASVGNSTAAATLRDAGVTVQRFQTAASGPLKLREIDPDNNAGTYPVQNLASAGTFVLQAYIPAISAAV